ncbi:hypothetical protein OB905_04585 [Halobacteria archaeon AArc-dxtr1]|nr:hypothetical protein [Halobacteria archaeon AArc-dxtr1]
MDVSELPWQRRVIGAQIVFGVLFAIQAYRGRIDWAFIVSVPVLYLVFMLALDCARHEWASGE